MSDHEGKNGNGNGSSGDDLRLAADLDDWVFAGRGIFRVVERLGRSIPPFGADRAAELAQLVAATNAEFDRLVSAWQTEIRPALVRHEDHPPGPAWLIAAHGSARHAPAVASPAGEYVGEYVDGAYVERLAADGAHLVSLVEALHDCIPPDDEGVAWSITGFHLPRVDEQFARVLKAWNTAVRPRLKKYELRAPRPPRR